MQREVLDKYPDAELRVYAIGFDVLAGDDRVEVDDSLLMDARVLEFWDNDREVGLWFPQQEEYRDLIGRPLAWDIYFLYGPEATWDEIPSPLVSSGSTIIARRDDLQKSILPMLSDD